MTEQDWIDLGKRAVACKAWRWLPGMLRRFVGHRDSVPTVIRAARVLSAEEQMYCFAHAAISTVSGTMPQCEACDALRAAMTPDLRDPATLGCLLALLFDTWPDGSIKVERMRGTPEEWYVLVIDNREWEGGVDALVSALGAAP